jgi:hypothetical protein
MLLNFRVLLPHNESDIYTASLLVINLPLVLVLVDYTIAYFVFNESFSQLLSNLDIYSAIQLPFEDEASLKTYKNLGRTSKRTQPVTITNINILTLFKEIIAVYSENYTEPINRKCSVTHR